MSLEQDAEYRRQLEHCDNIYVEVKKVMKTARQLSSECDNRILHSQAISSVIRGDAVEQMPHITEAQDEYEANHIKDMFCYIADKEVCDAVYDSFYDSKKHKHLIYVYNSIDDEPRKARVRVLTRMLWHTLIN